MKMGLAGKVILITGAAGGIGQAVAQMAAGEGATHLMLTDRDGPGCARFAEGLAGCEVGCFSADLAQPDGAGAVIAATLARFGRIDGLVNAAGLTTRGSVANGTGADWDAVFAVNARAGFFLMQGAIGDMRERGAAGAVVNILSMNAHCGVAELAIYAASKAAMATLTRNAAHAHMAEGIRVNGMNLGWVATPAEDHMQAVTLGRGAGWQAVAAAGLPLGRLVTADEAARLAVFLLGAASVPMSGAVVDFDQKVAGAIG
jgi:NAD(P)-dependent dehydrogenase (short-subunit alcohol dehydrogenase family)